jgi:hypothetical protein
MRPVQTNVGWWRGAVNSMVSDREHRQHFVAILPLRNAHLTELFLDAPPSASEA